MNSGLLLQRQVGSCRPLVMPNLKTVLWRAFTIIQHWLWSGHMNIISWMDWHKALTCSGNCTSSLSVVLNLYLLWSGLVPWVNQTIFTTQTYQRASYACDIIIFITWDLQTSYHANTILINQFISLSTLEYGALQPVLQVVLGNVSRSPWNLYFYAMILIFQELGFW